MCELLGLSSKQETTINISLSVLAQRGENPRMHGDGWGIAFHEGPDVRLIKDVGAAKNSQWVEFIKQQEIQSHDIIAHIRKSTVGRVSYSNTHPFVRELFGRAHSFAHNGTLSDITEDERFTPKKYFPIGETDSELAFCKLMDRMSEVWKKSGEIPALEERIKIVRSFADDMRSLGPSNFLYSDGHSFFAHGDVRHDPLTHAISWPGLHFIQLVCQKDGEKTYHSYQGGLSVEGQDDVITLFASVPLDDKAWIPLERGELVAVTKGRIKISQGSTQADGF
jgi:predicted glutamine amidotransferase